MRSDSASGLLRYGRPVPDVPLYQHPDQNAPVPVEKQVAILYAVTKGVLETIKVEDVSVYESGLYTYLDTDAAGVEVMQEIRTTGKLEQETEQKLRSVLDAYTENFLNTRPEK